MFSTIATVWEQPLKIAARTRIVMDGQEQKIKVQVMALRFQPQFIYVIHIIALLFFVLVHAITILVRAAILSGCSHAVAMVENIFRVPHLEN